MANYVKNRDLLQEIGLCKNTYCYYKAPEYEDYDVILLEPGHNGSRVPINPPNGEERLERIEADLKTRLQQGRQLRMNRIGNAITQTQKRIKSMKRWKTSPYKLIDDKEVAQKIESLERKIEFWGSQRTKPEDVVFRLMTYHGVPRIEDPEVKPQWESDSYEYVPFPPFKHIIYKDGKMQLVGRSFWSNGAHTIEEGQTSIWMYAFYQAMIDHIGSQANWRGYYDLEDMKSTVLMRLLKQGLKYSEADFSGKELNGIKKTQNPFSYLTSVINNTMKTFRSKVNGEITFMNDNAEEIRDEYFGGQ